MLKNRTAEAINTIAAASRNDETFMQDWNIAVAKSDRGNRADFNRALVDRIADQTKKMERFGVHQVFVLTEEQQRLLIEAEARQRDLVTA